MTESVFARTDREWSTRVAAGWAAFRGLPALLILLILALSLTLARQQQRGGEVRSRYLLSAQTAIAARDWPRAEMLSRKLVALRPNDARGLYLLALCAEQSGDVGRATRMMQQIAPLDRAGFDLAQWWLARRLATKPGPRSRDDLQQLRGHLQQFLVFREDHAEARMLLGQSELALGHIDPGLQEMAKAANDDPQLRLAVARVAARLGRSTVARAQAEQAAHTLRIRVQEEPSDVATRLMLSDVQSMLGDFQSAGLTLLEGLKRQDDERLREGLSRLAVSAFDILADSPTRTRQTFQQQLALLETSLKHAPLHPPLLKRLAQLAVDPIDDQQQAAALLRPYLEQEAAPAVVHMVLGTDAVTRREYADARRHFEAANRLQPEFPACLNNLAWSLLHGPQPDLTRALALVDRALACEPQRAEFRETRGQILARLKRFDEAVPELHAGLESESPMAVTHAVLAEAYDALGQTRQAAYHRELE